MNHKIQIAGIRLLLAFWIAVMVIPSIAVLLFAVSKVHAYEKPIDGIEDGSTWIVLRADGRCRAGNKFNIPYHVIFSDWTPNAGESFDEYLDRKDREIFNRPLTDAENALCDTMRKRNAVQWVVQPWRSGDTTRNVYRIDATLTQSGERVKIGVANVGDKCGGRVYVNNVMVCYYAGQTDCSNEGPYQIRQVTATNGQIGATFCKTA